jgi:hypothetical protein
MGVRVADISRDVLRYGCPESAVNLCRRKNTCTILIMEVNTDVHGYRVRRIVGAGYLIRRHGLPLQESFVENPAALPTYP